MAKSSVKISDIWEGEWIKSIEASFVGMIIMLVTALLIYFSKFWFEGSILLSARILMGVGFLMGLFIVAVSISASLKAKKLPGVRFMCPYCEKENRLLSTPTENFDCDHCERTIHFEFNVPVEVVTVRCQACRADHRVPVTALRYVCDRCNRPLNLGREGDKTAAAQIQEENDAMLQNYDVLLVAVDRQHENEMAFKIQNLLVINMKEAKRLMGTVSQKTPLIVGYDVPQRKAEVIRRQLQDLGGTATVRPTNVYRDPGARR